MRVLYDIQSVSYPNGWPVLIAVLSGLTIYLLFYGKVRATSSKRQMNIYNFMLGICLLVSILQFFTKQEQMMELQNLLSRYQLGNHQSSSGILTELVYPKDGIDRFSVGEQKFIRYSPHKQIPQYGCWTKFISTNESLAGKEVKIDYVIFEKYAKTPIVLGDEKRDQVCILKFEVINP